jgi:hypothetical protein
MPGDTEHGGRSMREQVRIYILLIIYKIYAVF